MGNRTVTYVLHRKGDDTWVRAVVIERPEEGHNIAEFAVEVSRAGDKVVRAIYYSYSYAKYLIDNGAYTLVERLGFSLILHEETGHDAERRPEDPIEGVIIL